MFLDFGNFGNFFEGGRIRIFENLPVNQNKRKKEKHRTEKEANQKKEKRKKRKKKKRRKMRARVGSRLRKELENRGARVSEAWSHAEMRVELGELATVQTRKRDGKERAQKSARARLEKDPARVF
jgi:hypothetical protein